MTVATTRIAEASPAELATARPPGRPVAGPGHHCRCCGAAVTPLPGPHPVAWCGPCRRVGIALPDRLAVAS